LVLDIVYSSHFRGSEFLEHKEYSDNHKPEANKVVPLEGFFEIDDRKYGKNNEGDDFLDGFKLSTVELAIAYAVGRDLKAILKKGDQPADQYRQP